MNEHSHLRTRPWMLRVGIVVLVAGHVIFFRHLRYAGISVTVVSGLVVLAIAPNIWECSALCTLSSVDDRGIELRIFEIAFFQVSLTSAVNFMPERSSTVSGILINALINALLESEITSQGLFDNSSRNHPFLRPALSRSRRSC